MAATAELAKRKKRVLERFSQSEAVALQLSENDHGVEARLGYEGTDVAFVTADGDLLGLNLFGEDEVVGVIVEPDEARLETRMRSVNRTDKFRDLRAQGAVLMGLTIGDLEKWQKYYVEAADLYPILGRRAWEQSGLRRFSHAEVASLSESIRELIRKNDNAAYLHKCGAAGLTKIKDGNRGEYVFDNGLGSTVIVPLRGVRLPQMQGSVLKETTKDTVKVIGIVLPLVGENKIELYTRAHLLGEAMSERLGCEVRFAVASAGQIRFWTEWGIIPEEKETERVSEGEILRLLSLGQNNLSPGLLSRVDSVGDGRWTLLDRSLLPGVISFVGQMTSEGRQIRALPPIQVFDPRARRNGKFATTALNGAVAILRVKEDMSFENMKRLAKPIEDRFLHLMNVVGRENRPRLVFLTPSLMRHWQSGGFWATNEQVRWLDSDRRREYGFLESSRRSLTSDVAGIYYTSAYVSPQIGGGQRGLLERDGMKDQFVSLDVGRQFGKARRPEYVRYADRLLALLHDGELAMWPHVLEPEALLATARIISQTFVDRANRADPLTGFLATELVANLPASRIEEVLGSEVAVLVQRLGKGHQGDFGDPKMGMIHVMSHVHVDHTSSAQNIRADVPFLMSLANLVMAEARDDLNSVDAEIMTVPEWWNSRPGKATPRKDRNTVVLKDGQIYNQGGTSVQLTSVEHSTIGAVGRRVRFQDGTVVVDPGDIRRWGRSPDRSLTELAALEWAKGDIDWLIMEATGIRKGANLSTDNWRGRLKKEPVTTDVDIRGGIQEVLRLYPGNTIVIYSSPYDLERNLAIMGAAEQAGRQTVMGVRHAMITSRYATEKRLLGQDSRNHVGFDLEVPTNYGLFLTQGSKTRSNVTALKTELEAKGVEIFDRDNILTNGGGRVLLFNPFGNEISSMAHLPLDKRLQVIWSTSIMYTREDLNDFLANKYSIIQEYTDQIWAQPNFWMGGRLPFNLRQAKGGVFHRSGHNSPLELLWFLKHFEGKKMGILWHHTENPVKATEYVKEAFPKADWKFVDSMPHMDMSKLPTKETRWMGPLIRLNKRVGE